MKPITDELEFKRYMSDSALKIARIMSEMDIVSEAYEQANGLGYGESFDDLAIDYYPFQLSFDEQADAIYEWSEEILES